MGTPVVLVIQRDGDFSRSLRDSGFQVQNLELVETEPLEDLIELNSRLDRIAEYDGLFITSPVAAKVFIRQLKSSGRNFVGTVYALGERARKLLAQSNLNVVYRDSANTAADLIGSFADGEFEGKRLLFIRGDKSMRTIPELLTGRARVDEVVVYQTREKPSPRPLLDSIKAQLANGQITHVCFFSPFAVETFVKSVAFDAAKKAAVAAIGETTARAAHDAGLSVDFVSPRASAEAFATNFADHLKNN